MDFRPELESFGYLKREPRRPREYIEATDANGVTYSQRIVELLMSTRIQSESVCLPALADGGYPKDPRDMSAGDCGLLGVSTGSRGRL